jgi:hypothetical protein
MKNDTDAFLDQLCGLRADSFEHGFANISRQLGLNTVLDRNEMTLLCEAAVRANLCAAALNEQAGNEGKIVPEQETKRTRLEWEFMTARAILYASPGWQGLSPKKQEEIERQFLTVTVAEECLAW